MTNRWINCLIMIIGIGGRGFASPVDIYNAVQGAVRMEVNTRIPIITPCHDPPIQEDTNLHSTEAPFVATMSSSRPMQDGKYYEKPSHKFSSNGDSASTNPHSSSGSASAAAATASHSHAMRAYVTEPPLAGNRNLALPGSQPRTDAEAVREAETRIQTHIDEVLRQLTPRQQ
ncbi:hypothetical protein PGQ11_012145 [Apiospora arundinis]|uniref:Uncharacterized protein n=1 Tax=Apiospora arundinis TaxID=335852 RepID=A0ABR2I2B7_9PEZI